MGPGGGERDGVHTCRAAGGRGPAGLVCWWLRSRTHPGCCEARPARPGAVTPPCEGGSENESARGILTLSPPPGAPLSDRALWTLPPWPPSPQNPTPNSTAPFSFCYMITEPEGQELFGRQRPVQPVSHPSVLDPRILAQTPTCPSHLQSLHFAPDLGPRSPVHQRR